MIPHTVTDCWQLAIGEAERYQAMLDARGYLLSGVERIKYTAKRDACYRIARLIRVGTPDARSGK